MGIIKPTCSMSHLSYVEHLRTYSGGLPEARPATVDTFVSHWWGEEFPKFVATLKQYARSRSRRLCKRKRDADDWAFWICAFANNQFAIDHALGVDGDVTSSAFAMALQDSRDVVAVIDAEAQIYRRIWCVFELFYADRMLPDRKLEVFLANEDGIISTGAVSAEVVDKISRILSEVNICNAQASTEADKTRIWRFIMD